MRNITAPKWRMPAYVYANFKHVIEYILQVLGRDLSNLNQTLLQVLIISIIFNTQLDILQDKRQAVLEAHDNIHFLLVVLDERSDRLHGQKAYGLVGVRQTSGQELMNDLHVVGLLVAENARKAGEYVEGRLPQHHIRRRAHLEQKCQDLGPPVRIVLTLLINHYDKNK